MTLPTSGAISMSQIRSELGKTGAFSLNDADGRKFAKNCGSGSSISMSNFHGAPKGVIHMNWGTTSGTDYVDTLLPNGTATTVTTPTQSRHSNSFTVIIVQILSQGAQVFQKPSGMTLVSSNGDTGLTVFTYYKTGALPASETWQAYSNKRTKVLYLAYRTESGKAITSVQAHGGLASVIQNSASNTLNVESNCNSTTGKSWLLVCVSHMFKPGGDRVDYGGIVVTNTAGAGTSGYTEGHNAYRTDTHRFKIWVGNGSHCDALRNNVPTTLNINPNPNNSNTYYTGVNKCWFGLNA